MDRFPSLGPLAGWADNEVIGLRHPIRLASTLDLPPEDFMVLMARFKADELQGNPQLLESRDQLGTVALNLTAHYISTRQWPKFNERMLQAEEQFLALSDWGPVFTVSLAAVYYNTSVAHHTLGNIAAAKRGWQAATDTIASLPADHSPLDDSRAEVEGVVWRQGEILNLH